jgi:hypothetical protein
LWRIGNATGKRGRESNATLVEPDQAPKKLKTAEKLLALRQTGVENRRPDDRLLVLRPCEEVRLKGK